MITNLNKSKTSLTTKTIDYNQLVKQNNLKINKEIQKIKQNKMNFKTMDELKKALQIAGNQWRENHKEIKKNKETGEIIEKVFRVPPRTVTDIMKKYVKLCTIGETSKDLEKSLLYYYDLDSGIYSCNSKRLEQLINIIENEYPESIRLEIIKTLRLEAPERQKTHNRNLIVVGNGIYNQQDKTFTNFHDDDFNNRYGDLVFTTKISTNYNENITHEPTFNGWSITKWFHEIAEGDEQKYKLLWQVIHMAINTNSNFRTCVLLVDNEQGATSKSTYSRLLEELAGKENTAPLQIAEFGNDSKLARSVNCSLIIGDDNAKDILISNTERNIKAISTFKSYVAGETILINDKYTKVFSYTPDSFIVENMNGLPRFPEKSEALYGRFRIIKFNHQYDKDNPENQKVKDVYIKDKNLLEWLLFKALQVEVKGKLIETQESRETMENLKQDNDVVYYFVKNYVDKLTSTTLPTKFLFKYFMAVMDEENNHQLMRQRSFTEQIKKILIKKGWKFFPKNEMPLESFYSCDCEKLNQFHQSKYYYNYSTEIKIRQSLFRKN